MMESVRSFPFTSILIGILALTVFLAPFNICQNPQEVTNGIPAGWSDDINLSNSELLDIEPHIVSEGQNVHLLWRYDGVNALYRKSTDNGRTWGPIVNIYTSPASVKYTHIAVSGQTVHAGINDLDGWDGIWCWASVLFSVAPTLDLQVRVHASYDGATFDASDQPIFAMNVARTSAASRVKSFPLTPVPPYLRMDAKVASTAQQASVSIRVKPWRWQSV